MLDEKTIQIYQAAKYIVLVDGTPCQIIIDQPCSKIDALLLEHKAESAYFITPENPFSIALSLEENTLRHQRFMQDLNKGNYPFYEGYGTNEVESWPKEKSYLILSNDALNMHNLAAKYGQNGFVRARLRMAAELFVIESVNYSPVN